MSASMKDLDPGFKGAGQKVGLEIWRMENFKPVTVPESSHGKFFTGNSYVVLKTTALKSGTLRHDIHYWLGEDISQDEAGAVAIKTVELNAALGGRAVQYREVQGQETEIFLSYFKPCIIPEKGGAASGFNNVEAKEHQPRLYKCKGKHVVHVSEVPFARASLAHDDVFILDTKSKIFQFNGCKSSVQERAKALEVVKYLIDTYHDGKCDIASIDDGKLMSGDSGEFWGKFGGFAPLPKKKSTNETESINDTMHKLFCVENGETVAVKANSLARELLNSKRCYILDCGIEIFVWTGRSASTLQERRAATNAVGEYIRSLDRTKLHVIHVMEGFETLMFRSKFDSWPQQNNKTASDDSGKGKVAALLKRQGLTVKGRLKAESSQESPQPYIDCTGDLQVWRVNGKQKTIIPDTDQSKFYSGDCYLFRYTYRGEEREEYLIGTWFGNQSVEEDRASAISQASDTVEMLKFVPTQVHIYEGSEPFLFFAIFQSFCVFKGGLSEGYKNYIAKNNIPDDTYSEDGLALFRIQGSGPENMQAIQVNPVANSLNSSYCYILHNGSTVFNWSGNLTTPDDYELVERHLDMLKPNIQSRLQKEGSESEQFWELLGRRTDYSSHKILVDIESDPHLFSCVLSKGDLKVTEVYNFNQDDLMTEDIYILHCKSSIYVWVGKEANYEDKLNALKFGEKFLELDFLLENLSKHTPIYIINEGNEPLAFTRFFKWDSKKSGMHGNSFQRKLAILKHGVSTDLLNKRRRRLAGFGRSAAEEKPQRSRSVCLIAERDRVRVRGRSPAFNALASKFENPNQRNLSTPPPMVAKIFPKSTTQDSPNPPSKSAAIAALTSGLEQNANAKQFLIPRTLKANPEVTKPISMRTSSDSLLEVLKPKPETIQEDTKEDEVDDEEGLLIYPYERLKTTSTDPVQDIDVSMREAYLSSAEFKEKFGMAKSAFHKLPKWKQNKLKVEAELF